LPIIAISSLRKMAAFDAACRALADARNALESFIYATRDKLYNEEVQEVSTEEQRTKLSEALDVASSWLSEHEFDQEPQPFRDQLKPLQDQYNLIALRVRERQQRPAAIDDAQFALNRAKKDLRTLATMEWVPEADVKRLQVMVDSTEKWLADKIAQQSALALHETPVLMVAEIGPQIAPIEKLADRLLKIPKPKPKPAPKKDAKDAKDAKEAKDEKEAKDSKEEGAKPADDQAKPETTAENANAGETKPDEAAKKDEL
jgi:hypothetical protein